MRRTDPISGYTYNTGGAGKAKLIVLLIVVAVVAVAATCAVFFLLSGDDTPSNPSGGGLVIDQSAGDYVAPVVDSKVEQNVAIPGWGSITIPANQQTVSVNFYNPEKNAGLYYLTFELRLLTSGSDYVSLYQSDAIPPGKHIQSITLSQPLDAGTYNAVIHVQPYRMSDETPTNDANMKTTLVVV